MYLLILFRLLHKKRSGNQFTFHYVSINSKIPGIMSIEYRNLHSTMYLLIPDSLSSCFQTAYHLHSTMYLLIHIRAAFHLLCGSYLHSTMYLLILRKTSYLLNHASYLHSTMYLLIPVDGYFSLTIT